METYSIREAADLAGVAYNTFKQHVTRGKVKATKQGDASRITEEDLHAYMVSEGLMVAAKKAVRAEPVEAAEAFEVPLGQLISRLPPSGQEALLEGMRTQSPEPFRKWKAGYDAEMKGKRTVPIDELPGRQANARRAVPK